MAKTIRRACESWNCPGCAGIRPGTEAIDAVIEEKSLGRSALYFIFGYDLGIAHKDFLMALGEHEVQKALFVGRLTSEDTGFFKDWVTFHGKQRIFVRGTTRAQYRQCSVCGRHLYFALGRYYLFPHPPDGQKLFYAGNGGLVVTEDLVERITLNRWRNLSCEKIEVLPKPLDGLPNLPPP
jgi:hypothetical protein